MTGGERPPASASAGAGLFRPVSLQRAYNAGRRLPGDGWDAAAHSTFAGLPGGPQRYWGIPFQLAPGPAHGSGVGGGGEEDAAWVLLGGAAARPHAVTIDLPGGGESPSYVVVLHVAEVPAAAAPPPLGSTTAIAPPLPIWLTMPGQPVAAYTLVYEEGSERTQPIRWRFEINGGPGRLFERRAFAALAHEMDLPLDFRSPIPAGGWFRHQEGVQRSDGPYWVYALPNPLPDRPLRAVRLAATGAAAVGVAGLTLFYGRDHPLRHRELQSFRVTLPPDLAPSGTPEAVDVAVDLGIVARTYAVPAFDPESWLAGSSGPPPASVPAEPLRELLLDLTATTDASLTVGGHTVPMREAYERGKAQSAGGAVRVELLTPRTAWLHVTVQDGAGGKATPARVHFRAPDGRYLPPYGHRHEVNAQTFEDYGADLTLHGTPYAYVDGAFQIELPVGEAYVEVFKGFEYQPRRQRLHIQPGQRELQLQLERALDWRHRGWVTADTHVHFLSPHTARLEGRAEGINVIHLLASQWGDLFTNVGDITGAAAISDGDTLVWVGTENRQHLLGHLGLLGVRGAPVFPMTTGGPPESYLGDVTRTTLAGWTEEARRRGGLAVAAHFPTPYCEVAADIVLDKLDAIELHPSQYAARLHEWYRYLNCGYRLTAVAGTDKMSAGTPLGSIRTYAQLDDALSMDAWTAAVRAGRTFTTTGPLLALRVEGRGPGDEIQLPTGGGTLHVEVVAESIVPFHAVEVVMNGQVVAAEQYEHGASAGRLQAPLRVPGSAWIAARCTSRQERWIGAVHVVAAHTSPVYVVAGGEAPFNPSDAVYVLTMLEGGLTWLDTLARPADAEQPARHRRVFEEARRRVQEQVQRHAASHRPHPAHGGHTHQSE